MRRVTKQRDFAFDPGGEGRMIPERPQFDRILNFLRKLDDLQVLGVEFLKLVKHVLNRGWAIPIYPEESAILKISVAKHTISSAILRIRMEAEDIEQSVIPTRVEHEDFLVADDLTQPGLALEEERELRVTDDPFPLEEEAESSLAGVVWLALFAYDCCSQRRLSQKNSVNP